MTIRLFFCLIFSVYVQASNAESISTLQTLSFAARSSLCETLLQSDKQLAAIPLNSSALVELLNQLGMVHFLDTADFRLASLTSPRTQEYISEVTQALSNDKSPLGLETYRALQRLTRFSTAPNVEIFEMQSVSKADLDFIILAVKSELYKIPRRFLNEIWRAGRGIVIVPGKIVEHPMLTKFRSVVVANGQLADETLGAANRQWRGPAIVSWSSLDSARPRSTLLHEVFHLMDSTVLILSLEHRSEIVSAPNPAYR